MEMVERIKCLVVEENLLVMFAWKKRLKSLIDVDEENFILSSVCLKKAISSDYRQIVIEALELV